MIFSKETIEKALDIAIISDHALEENQALWQSMIDGKALWNTKDVPSLHLASSICREISNNTTFELEADLTGNDILKEQFMNAVDQMPTVVSILSGLAKIVLKPFVRVDKILVTIATPGRFFPIKYNEVGTLTSVAFADIIETAEDVYTLLEVHTWDETTSGYTIEYKAFHSKQPNDLGKAVPVSSVEAWAHLVDIQWQNITQPLFVEINMPNNQSIFANAVELIRLADQQYGRTVWEYEGGELAIDASIDMFRSTGKVDKYGKREVVLPKGKERLFRVGDVSAEDFKMQTFSPEFRDTSLFNGLNEHKRAIEFACGIAYATISDPNLQDKTATEIRATKQRFLITIRTIQKIIEEAYTHLAESINILGQLYGLSPASNYEVSLTWGDSVMEDPDVEYQRRKELAALGYISPVAFVAWYFSVSEEEAAKMIPAQQTESIE